MRFTVILSLLLFALNASGVNQIDAQFNSWYMYFGNHRLSDKFGIHSEYQWRRSGLVENWQQSLLRLGLDYHASEKVMLTAGYGWIVSYPYGKQAINLSFNEQRIWQQLVLKQKANRFHFHHRYRLEERFLENRVRNAEGNSELESISYRWRARYRFLLSIPIDKPSMSETRLFASVYDEAFLGFGKGIAANVLDQNRLFLSLGYRLNNAGNIQLGYLNQFLLKPDGIHAERNHTLQVAFTYNLDFRKA